MIRLAPLPSSLSPYQPATLVATFFGVGRLPYAPGTWGALAAVPPGVALALLWGPAGLVAGAVLATAAGLWAAGIYARASGRPDPPEAVIDEVAGQWLTMAAAPVTPLGIIAAFVLFRVFDVVKPWPIGVIDKTLKGGAGIMLDDLMAAGYALCILAVLRWLSVF